jgi:hypothetical protein
MHCALPEYYSFHYVFVVFFYLFCRAAISVFQWCVPDCTYQVCLCVHCIDVCVIDYGGSSIFLPTANLDKLVFDTMLFF